MKTGASGTRVIALLAVWALVTCLPAASQDPQTTQSEQSTQQRALWNLGVRPARWTGTSALTIENRCRHNHLFGVSSQDLPFLQFQSQTRNVAVSGHQTKSLGVKFDTDDMKAGDYDGQVVVRCLDCRREPGCTQDHEFVPVHLVVGPPTDQGKNELVTEPPLSNPPAARAPEPPVVTDAPRPGQDQARQECEQGAEEPMPDLLTLLRFKGYTARVTDLSGEALRGAQTSVTSAPQFRALLSELQKKGYSFPEAFAGASTVTIDLRQGRCATRLTVSSFRSNIKADGTMAGITVAMDGSAPDRSLFLAHVTNVYALQPEQMPANNPGISFNHEPWFTVQIGEAPPARYISAFWPIIWYRYWWYDSHRHANWWYGCYQWWWWRYRWYGKPWFWWYNWWWGYYYWQNWNFWSTWWAPYGPYLGLPPE